MKILETDRIILRELEVKDIPTIAAIYTDPEVMRYIGEGVPLSYQSTKERILSTIEDYRIYGFGAWAMILKENNEFIGRCGLKYWWQFKEVEVGYLIKKAYWGKGLTTEAARATVAYGFDTFKLPRIISIAYPQNKASITIMKKLGLSFKRESLFNDRKIVIYQLDRSQFYKNQSKLVGNS